ncbi:unnamed protein product [Rotaria sordida]|uniref:Uncharacterized protein n=1 Tax=Rotaria sordida TaxID=392033 RepID=A0A815E8J4_9BILA|nr:unnamed protein product [Rotaria sordida]CAF1308322.1 unnamed protein product [Rotaria sordida]
MKDAAISMYVKWYEVNATINDDAPGGIKRSECRLIRTYANDETTLRPVPPLGEYSWKQISINYGLSDYRQEF